MATAMRGGSAGRTGGFSREELGLGPVAAGAPQQQTGGRSGGSGSGPVVPSAYTESAGSAANRAIAAATIAGRDQGPAPGPAAPASAPAAADPMMGAPLQGLGQALRDPGAGFAPDVPIAAPQELGQRTPSQPLDVLRQIVAARGKVY